MSAHWHIRDQYRSLDPVGLLAEIRATQEELGKAQGLEPVCTRTAPSTAATFAKTLGKAVKADEPRANASVPPSTLY